MSTIEITINNKIFHVACEDGDEDIVYNLAKKLGEKIDKLKVSSPSASNEYLFLLCALSTQNELSILEKHDIQQFEEDYSKLLSSLTEILDTTNHLIK